MAMVASPACQSFRLAILSSGSEAAETFCSECEERFTSSKPFCLAAGGNCASRTDWRHKGQSQLGIGGTLVHPLSSLSGQSTFYLQVTIYFLIVPSSSVKRGDEWAEQRSRVTCMPDVEGPPPGSSQTGLL